VVQGVTVRAAAAAVAAVAAAATATATAILVVVSTKCLYYSKIILGWFGHSFLRRKNTIHLNFDISLYFPTATAARNFRLSSSYKWGVGLFVFRPHRLFILCAWKGTGNYLDVAFKSVLVLELLVCWLHLLSITHYGVLPFDRH
jgi:hypothetical protein